MSAIFLSHSSKDKAVSAEVRERLAAQGHRSVFLDFDPDDGIPPGRDWEQELYHRLRACQAVIVICSQHSMTSKWCFAEITHAKSLGKHLFPIKIDTCQVERVLTTHQVLDLTKDPEEAYQRLWRGLKVAGLDPTDAFDWDGSRPPYPGLLAFQEADAAVFFGRDTEILQGLELLNRLRQFGGAHVIMVLGASGSGKSSLVRAGLLPRLRRNKDQWLVIAPFRPQEHPLQELAIVLAAAFQKYGNKRNWKDIWESLRRAADVSPVRGEVLINLAKDLRTSADLQEARILLIIDQTEEVLNSTKGEEASQLLHLLQAAFVVPNSPLMAICTLRSDFLGAFQQHPVARQLAFEDLKVGPLSAERFVKVIEGPSEKAGIQLEAGLTELMLNDTKTESALPLLAFTLRELYERYSNKGVLTVEAYRDKLGGLAGSVAKAAESVFTAMPLTDDKEVDLRKSFLSMVRINDEGQYARRPAPWDDLPLKIHPLLERFVQARLLVSRGESNEKILEVAHEELFRAWDRLKGWLDEDREFLLWRNRLSEACEEWKRTGHSSDVLLRGALLAEATRWLMVRPDNLEQTQQDFIQESAASKQREEEEEKMRQQRELEAERQRAAEQAASSKRFRRLAYVLAGVLVLAMGAAIFATIQQKQADAQRRRALALQLATQADAQLDNTGEGLELSLLLATESLKSAWTPEGYAVWSRAVALLPRQPTTWIDTQEKYTLNLVFHPTHPWLAILSTDQIIRIRDIDRGSVVKDLSFEDKGTSNAFQFSPDGHWLAAVSQKGLALWDTETWQRSDFPAITEGNFDLAFSRTGDLLAITGDNQPLRILSTVSWEDQSPIETYNIANDREARTRVLAFSPWQLATSDYRESVVKFWKLRPEEPRTKEVLHIDIRKNTIESLSFSHGGNEAAVVTATDLRFWPEVALNHAFAMAPQGQVNSDELDVDSWTTFFVGDHVVFSPDDRYLLSSGSVRVQLWDTSTRREVARFPLSGPADFNSSGDMIAIGEKKVGLWPKPSRGSAAAIEHNSDVHSVAFSPDGRWMATGQENSEFSVFHTGSWKNEFVRKLKHEVSFVAFTPDGQWLIAESGQYDEIKLDLYQVNAWKPLSSIPQKSGVSSLRISPDGRYMMVQAPPVIRRAGGDIGSGIKIWDISTTKEVAWRTHEDEDGTLDIVRYQYTLFDSIPLSQGGDLALLDKAGDWEDLKARGKDSVSSNYGQASPDGHWWASYGYPQEGVAFLEPSTRREIMVLRPAQTHVKDMDFDPNGRWLATASGKTVDIWLLGPVEELVKESCARLSRNLSEEEWHTYLGSMPQRPCCNSLISETSEIEKK